MNANDRMREEQLQKVEVAFPGMNVKPYDKGYSFKINTQKLSGCDIMALADLEDDFEIEIKRSGTGLTVILKDKVFMPDKE